MDGMKTVSILGSTGSVGRSTVDLLLSQPDRFEVQALTCNANAGLAIEQAKKLNAKRVVAADPKVYHELKEGLTGTGIEAAAGPAALLEAAAMPADWTMAAIVGVAGLAPIMAAIRQGGCVAIANKEPLVAAGPFVLEAARRAGTTLLPVDSEHNAIFQVFDHNHRAGIDKIILTASGGPFLDWPLEKMARATPAQAVAHPNWSMGAKISVDSATMMNKALEIIEAHYLFDMPAERIEVLVHPQSIIHSLVEYKDGSVLVQMGAPDMRTPIAHALAWPERMETTGRKLDLSRPLTLDLRPLDRNWFPAVGMAYNCLKAGPAACVAFNAANEIAVAAFLEKKIGFLQIAEAVGEMLAQAGRETLASLDDVLLCDRAVRERTKSHIIKKYDQVPLSGRVS
jgi:1-deoxy-D-xylulose-5-phosphate reductoisomerase